MRVISNSEGTVIFEEYDLYVPGDVEVARKFIGEEVLGSVYARSVDDLLAIEGNGGSESDVYKGVLKQIAFVEPERAVGELKNGLRIHRIYRLVTDVREKCPTIIGKRVTEYSRLNCEDARHLIGKEVEARDHHNDWFRTRLVDVRGGCLMYPFEVSTHRAGSEPVYQFIREVEAASDDIEVNGKRNKAGGGIMAENEYFKVTCYDAENESDRAAVSSMKAGVPVIGGLSDLSDSASGYLSGDLAFTVGLMPVLCMSGWKRPDSDPVWRYFYHLTPKNSPEPKIYHRLNAEDARHLIGKEVEATNDGTLWKRTVLDAIHMHREHLFWAPSFQGAWFFIRELRQPENMIEVNGLKYKLIEDQ